MDNNQFLELIRSFFEKAGTKIRKNGEDYNNPDASSFMLLDEGRKAFYLLEIGAYPNILNSDDQFKEIAQKKAAETSGDPFFAEILLKLGKAIHSYKTPLAQDGLSANLKPKSAAIISSNIISKFDEYLKSISISPQKVPYKSFFGVYFFTKEHSMLIEKYFLDTVPKELINQIITPAETAGATTVAETKETITPQIVEIQEETPQQNQSEEDEEVKVANETSPDEDLLKAGVDESVLKEMDKLNNLDLSLKHERELFDSKCELNIKDIDNSNISLDSEYSTFVNSLSKDKNLLFDETEIEHKPEKNEDELDVNNDPYFKDKAINQPVGLQSEDLEEEKVEELSKQETNKLLKTSVAEKEYKGYIPSDKIIEPISLSPSTFYSVIKHLWQLIIYFPAYICHLLTRGKMPPALIYAIGSLATILGAYFYPITALIKKFAQPLLDMNTQTLSLMMKINQSWSESFAASSQVNSFANSLFDLSIIIFASTNYTLEFLTSLYYLKYLLAAAFAIAVIPAWRVFGRRMVYFLMVVLLTYIPLTFVVNLFLTKVITSAPSAADVLSTAKTGAEPLMASTLPSILGFFTITTALPFFALLIAAKSCKSQNDKF